MGKVRSSVFIHVLLLSKNTKGKEDQKNGEILGNMEKTTQRKVIDSAYHKKGETK